MTKPTDPIPLHRVEADSALSVTVNCLAALQNLVSFDEAVIDQCKGDAFKLMAKLTRAKSRLAYAASKKGTKL